MISNGEKEYLRDLAKKQLELAHSPLMKEREKLWYAHNELQGGRPVIAVGEGHYWREMCPAQRCTGPVAREIEYQLQNNIYRVELIDDDKVTPDFYSIKYNVRGPVRGLG